MTNPMFQHRHYAAIAAVLGDAREEEKSIFDGGPTSLAREGSLDRLEDRLLKLFERDNDNFDRRRFVLAARRAPDMHGKDKR